MDGAVTFVLDAELLVWRTEKRKQVVHAGFLKLGTNALNFLLVVLWRVRLIQDVVLLVLQKYATEAVLDILAEGAELALTRVRAVETEITRMAIGAVNALI